MMKTIYMAIWYRCNQACKGCPCSRNVDKGKNMTFENVKALTEKALQNADEPISVTLSGGEPTLHPDFMKIMRYFRSKDVYVTILTNAEKFFDTDFCDEFLSNISIFRTRIVTTIHSSHAEIHEEQNQSKGSFIKSVSGLKYLFNKGIGISIKHCITSVNYKDTLGFVKFVDKEFHPSVDIQLFGLDYCGLTKEQADKLYCHYAVMQPEIESALDASIEMMGRNGRRTTVHNIPLCWVDPYYWSLFELTSKKSNYEFYFDPASEKSDFGDDSGRYSKECENCYVNEICPGTYKSLFEYFGDGAVAKVEDKTLDKETASEGI